MSTTVAKKTLTISDHLGSPRFKAEIAKLLPKHITPERMIRVAFSSIRKTPKLLQCDMESFFDSMLKAAKLGVEVDGRCAHLVPYGKTCTLVVDYKGLVELMYHTGNVDAIHADKVCENDDFVYDRGEVVRHRIDLRKPRGEAYAYYCIITRKGGGQKCEVMTREEIDKIRNRSPAGKSGPWVSDYDEMAKKTVFKRAAKWAELSPEIRDAVEHDDRDYIDGRITDRRSSEIESTDDLTALLSKPQEEPLPAIGQADSGEGFAARIAAADSAADLREIRREVIASDLTTEETDEVLALISERVDVLDPQ